MAFIGLSVNYGISKLLPDFDNDCRRYLSSYKNHM